ncbi:hypothetical protein [Streptomyces sp. SS]|uniref:hypothetical protein n=1 Tax=Streptomyces sp. SS TaxID=260742 RepID=UPI0002E06D4A|nr:hypothetical protein [Streptomyces sp. SS]
MRLFFCTFAAALVLGGLILGITGSFVAAVACAAYVVVVIPLAVLVGRAIRGRSTPPSSD